MTHVDADGVAEWSARAHSIRFVDVDLSPEEGQTKVQFAAALAGEPGGEIAQDSDEGFKDENPEAER